MESEPAADDPSSPYHPTLTRPTRRCAVCGGTGLPLTLGQCSACWQHWEETDTRHHYADALRYLPVGEGIPLLLKTRSGFWATITCWFDSTSPLVGNIRRDLIYHTLIHPDVAESGQMERLSRTELLDVLDAAILPERIVLS